MDAADSLPCTDIVCARGGHYACHDLPPPLRDRTAEEQASIPPAANSLHGTTSRPSLGEMYDDLTDPPDSVEVSEG